MPGSLPSPTRALHDSSALSLSHSFWRPLSGRGLAPPARHPIPEPLKKAPPTRFECRWADTAITIDGAADDEAWKHAETIDAFHLPWLGDKARMSRTATAAKLLWDREYLYFLAEMEDTDLFADIKEHDGNLWTNDVFEIFFRPDATKPGYYEFQVNAAGAVFDAFLPETRRRSIRAGQEGRSIPHRCEGQARGTLNNAHRPGHGMDG